MLTLRFGLTFSWHGTLDYGLVRLDGDAPTTSTFLIYKL